MATVYFNTLVVEGPSDQVAAFRHRAEGVPAQYVVRTLKHGDKASDAVIESQALSFHSFRPVPKSLLSKTHTGEDGFVNLKPTKRLDSYRSGLIWELRCWGCAGDADYVDLSTVEECKLVYEFLTYDGKPDAVLWCISQLFPRLVLTLEYEDDHSHMPITVTVTNGEWCSAAVDRHNGQSNECAFELSPFNSPSTIRDGVSVTTSLAA